MPWNPAAVNVFEYSVSEAHGLSVEALEDQRLKAHHARILPVACNIRYSEMGHAALHGLAATAGAGDLKMNGEGGSCCVKAPMEDQN